MEVAAGGDRHPVHNRLYIACGSVLYTDPSGQQDR
jgi:hypothetical protein